MAYSRQGECVAVLLGRLMAGLAIVLCLPLLILLAALVKISSRGPILHISERLGKGSRPFQILKFRTMRVSAEHELSELLADNPELHTQWQQRGKIHRDPRVTALGRFLRSSSLDELPQLWNILRGEMAWVGPRPIIRAEVARYGDDYERLQSIRPGLTGLWQVSGRSTLTYPQRVKLDLRYIENHGLGLDTLILLKTFREIFLARGAL